MGVDELSNTIIVSAQEGLLENIGEMIDSLDVAAKPSQSTIRVLKVNRGVETSLLQSKLAKILAKPQPPQQPQQNPQQQPGQQQPMPQPAAQQVTTEAVSE